MEISKILEAQPKATVHGVVVGLSPVKDSRTKTRKWFDGEIANSETVKHFVSFDSRLWHAMDKSHEERSAIVLKNCSIQKSRRTLNFEIIANDKTKVDSSPRKFQLDDRVNRQVSIKVLAEAPSLRTRMTSYVTGKSR